jgi:hypothetical protein
MSPRIAGSSGHSLWHTWHFVDSSLFNLSLPFLCSFHNEVSCLASRESVQTGARGSRVLWKKLWPTFWAEKWVWELRLRNVCIPKSSLQDRVSLIRKGMNVNYYQNLRRFEATLSVTLEHQLAEHVKELESRLTGITTRVLEASVRLSTGCWYLSQI